MFLDTFDTNGGTEGFKKKSPSAEDISETSEGSSRSSVEIMGKRFSSTVSSMCAGWKRIDGRELYYTFRFSLLDNIVLTREYMHFTETTLIYDFFTFI